jgi:hypothetical protein
MRAFYVDTVEVLVSPHWTITDRINSRSIFNGTIVEEYAATISEGATFQVYNDGTEIYEGIINSVRKREGVPGIIYYDITVVDNSAIADKRLAAATYEDETAGDIVSALITAYLSYENVTAGTIQDGPVIQKATFNYISCTEALNYLADITGYYWYIDKDKALHFCERTTNLAPYDLTDSVQHWGFEHDRTLNDYRNTQYVRGGKGRTSTQTDEVPTPAPDGVSRKFVLRFPVAEKPVIMINSTAIVSANVGVNGLDTGKQWYFSYDSQIVTQDTGESVLTAGSTISVTYIGLKNLFVKVDNAAEVAARAAIEGNSGMYEKLTKEVSIDETSAALDFGEGLILKYGDIKDIVTFHTEVSGLAAGQLIRIDKDLFGLDDRFLIEAIVITPADGDKIDYAVRALDGSAIGGWEEFFKLIIRGNRTFTIAENEVLIILYSYDETVSWAGEYDISAYTALYPLETLYPSETLYPGSASSTANVTD